MFDILEYEKYLIMEFDLQEIRELKRNIRETLPPGLEEEADRVFKAIIEMETKAVVEGVSRNELIDIRFDLTKKYHMTKT